LRRRRGPDAFQPARNRIAANAGVVPTLPTKALKLDAGPFRFTPHVGRGASAVRLAERVPAGDQRDGLFVVHRHATEGLANIPGRGDGIRRAVRPLRIHVDETHLHGAKRVGQLTITAVALVAKPGLLPSPVRLVGFPDILASASEPERLE